jgi:hypothetical protein
VREAEALARGFGEVFPDLSALLACAYQASLPVNDIAVLHEPNDAEPAGGQPRSCWFAGA